MYMVAQPTSESNGGPMNNLMTFHITAMSAISEAEDDNKESNGLASKWVGNDN